MAPPVAASEAFCPRGGTDIAFVARLWLFGAMRKRSETLLTLRLSRPAL